MPRGVYPRPRKKGPLVQPTAVPGLDAPLDEASWKPPSRLIEAPAMKGIDMHAVHWAPEFALAWSCVRCRASFRRPDDLSDWRPW